MFGLRKKEKKASGNKLNMLIAQTHRLSSRIVGMQLTTGNFVAIVLSATQMSLGFIFLTSTMTQGRWYMILMVVLIGIALAILIERLSIGGLSAVRVASARRKLAEDTFYARLLEEHREATEIEQANLKRQVDACKKDIRAGWGFGALGMLMSTVIGDIFWHTIFEPLGNPWLVYPMSSGCAAVIGLTFVNSELFKSMLDGVLREILMDLHLMKAAVVVEQENMQLDMLVNAYSNVREDEEIREPLEAKIGRVVVKRLGGFADNVGELSMDTFVVESLPAIPPANRAVAALPAPRGQYALHRDEMRRLLTANPGMSVGELSKHFGKSKSTMQDWLNKYRAGL